MCQLLLCILAVFCPPLAVMLDRGCHAQAWLNLLLTILLWIPGVIHAWYVILCAPRDHCHGHVHHETIYIQQRY